MNTPSLLAVALTALVLPAAAVAQKPNVIVIVSDDAGWADFSMQGSREFKTARIDSIASNGVRFTQGYVTASVCSPSRAGLMTGRYQQRFGHEFNMPPRLSEANGLPVDEVTIADYLHEADYRTIALGKWHLGYADRFHPLSRGFDDYFGFLKGARSYWPLDRTNQLNRLLRDREPVAEKFTYMTDELGKQAAAYIDKHKDRPFFLYLAFNAVHRPMHAKPEELAKLTDIEPPRRRKLAAMTKSLDDAVGVVLDELAKHDLTDNTLLFFVNDNGGPTANGSSNEPLRGHKGQSFEGGIRVPFLVQWPAKLPKGKVYEHPVITLDILPTALAAAGVTDAPKNPLDGKDLTPYLTGKVEGRPHESLFWRKGPSWAVRHGDWKLVKQGEGAPMLFDMAKDGNETVDLASKSKARVAELLAMYKLWDSELHQPRWRGGAGRRRR